uniref:Uncharacterized protein n=2 Tax=Gossypium TaxID=3633 RepID=A0A0D2PPM0_GOSRA|nr:hypothetical protein B456_001G104200 [Gossypium raimondii]
MEPSPGCPVSHQHRPMILYPHHHHTILCPAHHNHHHTKSCPLHHHHHYTISCPLHHHHHHHHHHLITHHSHVIPTLAPLVSTTAPNETHHSGNPALQEQEYEQLQQVEEEDDEEDEPIFVLTDEWREFFAKSEAKRKLGNNFFSSFFI